MIGWLVLALWATTEATGAVMLQGFIRRGGLHDEALDTHYPATLFANFSLGTASVIPWAFYLGTGIKALAWATFVQLIAVVMIGTILALPWHRARRQGHPTPRGGGVAAFRYSRVVEASHGMLAWLTAACPAWWRSGSRTGPLAAPYPPLWVRRSKVRKAPSTEGGRAGRVRPRPGVAYGRWLPPVTP